MLLPARLVTFVPPPEWLHFGSIKKSILADSVKLHVLYRRK